MKKTIRRIVLIFAVILTMVSLTGCELDADVEARVVNDGNEIVISTNHNCYANITVSLSTGDSVIIDNIEMKKVSPKIITLSEISTKYFNEAFSKYVAENSSYIQEVSVTKVHDGGAGTVRIFIIMVFIVMYIVYKEDRYKKRRRHYYYDNF